MALFSSLPSLSFNFFSPSSNSSLSFKSNKFKNNKSLSFVFSASLVSGFVAVVVTTLLRRCCQIKNQSQPKKKHWFLSWMFLLRGEEIEGSGSDKIKKERVVLTNNVEETPQQSSASLSTSTSTKVMDSTTLHGRMLRKAECALMQRTSRLIVIIERCVDDHNYSAVLRTVEALGVQNVWLIDTHIHVDVDEDEDENTTIAKIANSKKEHHLFAKRAAEWLTIRRFDNVDDCVSALKQEGKEEEEEEESTISRLEGETDSGYELWVTDLSQCAVCLTREDLAKEDERLNIVRRRACNEGEDDAVVNVIPHRVAIALGSESAGCTAKLLASADRRVYLPLRGFADSLNLSVAAALCVQRMFDLSITTTISSSSSSSSISESNNQTLIGSMSHSQRERLRKQWYMKLARQRMLTSGGKKKRRRLIQRIRNIETIEDKLKSSSSSSVLTKEQQTKLQELPILREELHTIDGDVEQQAESAVQRLLDDPLVEPLDDMRRPDDHRVGFVAKSTRMKRTEDEDPDLILPATVRIMKIDDDTLENSSAAYFRGMVG